MKQKICALALTAALSISLLTIPAFAAETSFKDVSGHWAADAIASVVEKKLFNGTSEDTFSPDASMNRGMFVTVLGRFAEGMGYPVSGTSTFSDVAADAYYAKYVAWGAANGIVNGVSATEFSPNADVTREQMCALFVRFLEFIKYPLPETKDLTFVDAGKISGWAVEPVKTAVTLGLIQGAETAEGVVFNPADSATRAQVATVFLRQDGLEGIKDLKPDAPAEPAPGTDTKEPETQTTQPATDPAQGGGGGGGGGSSVTPAPQPEPSKEYTAEEKEKEAQIAGYLEEMVHNYENMPYLNSTQQIVKDTYSILMSTIKDALAAREKGAFLSEDYVKTNYADAIDQVKSAYKSLDEDQNTQFMNVGLRLGNTSHTRAALNYFGFKGI